MNRCLRTLLENGNIWDLKELLKILPELKERLLTNEWSEAMNKCLRALLENGNIWDLKELLEILPELKERLLNNEWSEAMNKCLRRLCLKPGHEMWA